MQTDSKKNETPTDANNVLAAVLYAISQIETEKNVARMANDDDYRRGYLKALTNVTAILDEYVVKKHCH